jgi:hypothetical protein
MKYLLYRYEQLICPELIFGLVYSYYPGFLSYKYRKKQNKTIPDTTKQLKRHSAIESDFSSSDDNITLKELKNDIKRQKDAGIVLFCFFLYIFLFFCLGVTFKAFGDPLESVDEVSSL